MEELVFDLDTEQIDIQQLDAELRAVLRPEEFSGISTGDNKVRVHLKTHPDQSLRELIKTIVETHEPVELPRDKENRQRDEKITKLALIKSFKASEVTNLGDLAEVVEALINLWLG